METKNHAVTFHQKVENVFSHLRKDEYKKLTKTLGSLWEKKTILLKKLEKNFNFHPKVSKSRKVKLLKTNPLKPKTMQ